MGMMGVMTLLELLVAATVMIAVWAVVKAPPKDDDKPRKKPGKRRLSSSRG